VATHYNLDIHATVFEAELNPGAGTLIRRCRLTVRVTDENGLTVSGLKKADFAVHMQSPSGETPFVKRTIVIFEEAKTTTPAHLPGIYVIESDAVIEPTGGSTIFAVSVATAPSPGPKLGLEVYGNALGTLISLPLPGE
jgi:hypothetical protein